MLSYECLNCIRSNTSMDLASENDLFFTEVFFNMTTISITKYKITVLGGWHLASKPNYIVMQYIMRTLVTVPRRG